MLAFRCRELGECRMRWAHLSCSAQKSASCCVLGFSPSNAFWCPSSWSSVNLGRSHKHLAASASQLNHQSPQAQHYLHLPSNRAWSVATRIELWDSLYENENQATRWPPTWYLVCIWFPAHQARLQNIKCYGHLSIHWMLFLLKPVKPIQ